MNSELINGNWTRKLSRMQPERKLKDIENMSWVPKDI